MVDPVSRTFPEGEGDDLADPREPGLGTGQGPQGNPTSVPDLCQCGDLAATRCSRCGAALCARDTSDDLCEPCRGRRFQCRCGNDATILGYYPLRVQRCRRCNQPTCNQHLSRRLLVRRVHPALGGVPWEEQHLEEICSQCLAATEAAKAAELQIQATAKKLRALDVDTLIAMLRESPVPYVSVWQRPQLPRGLLRRRPPRRIAVKGWVLPVPAQASRGPQHLGMEPFPYTVVMVDELGPGIVDELRGRPGYDIKRGWKVGAVVVADGSLELNAWPLTTDPEAVAAFVLQARRQP